MDSLPMSTVATYAYEPDREPPVAFGGERHGKNFTQYFLREHSNDERMSF